MVAFRHFAELVAVPSHPRSRHLPLRGRRGRGRGRPRHLHRLPHRRHLGDQLGQGPHLRRQRRAGVDYSALPSVALTFAPGETTKSLTVDVTVDTAPEANETFNLVLSAATGATLSDTSATATIADDDGVAYLGVDDVWVGEGDSGTTAATFTITRSGNTTAGSTVKVQTKPATAAAGVDYSALGSTTVAFAPGQTTATVTVDPSGTATIVDDE